MEHAKKDNKDNSAKKDKRRRALVNISTRKIGKARRNMQRKTIRTIMPRKTRQIRHAKMKIMPTVKSELGQISHWQSDLFWIHKIRLSVVSPKHNP